ncbi:MAG TPA: GerMN domain-containing protein [Candidatus Krumholzibacteria bacterium]|nr:GerMN domain-containing protein [Candidatus Krumholzibacteria bacterium]
MDDLSRFPGETGSDHGGLRVRHLVALAVLALAAIAGFMWMVTRQPARAPEEPAPREVSRVPEGSRTVTLFFADAEEPVIYGETREVAVGRRLDEQVRQVLDALIAGPERETGISAIPKGTQLLSVLLDDQASVLYLDFSAELVAAHPGGSSAEYCTIAAIVKTVAENFPDIKGVQLLVDGSQVETIAGHIRADAPFRVNDWR